MKGRIERQGDDYVIVFPISLLDSAGLVIGDEVVVRVDNGAIIVDKSGATWPTLASLLEGITDESVHSGTDTGPAIGKEFC